jgi:hypothetical protein
LSRASPASSSYDATTGCFFVALPVVWVSAPLNSTAREAALAVESDPRLADELEARRPARRLF